MTGLLKESLRVREQADAQTTPRFDVDDIVRAGDGRVRRSRVRTGLAAAGVAGVLVAGGLAVPSLLDGTSEGQVAGAPQAAAGPFADNQLTFAVGDVVHWGTESFDLGHRITSYVRTDHGMVLSTAKDGDTTAPGVVRLFDGTDTRQIGSADGNELRADDTGSLVAWTDSSGPEPMYVVHDTADGSEVRLRASAPAGEGPEVLAVDDGWTYIRTADGIARWGGEDGTVEPVWEAPAVIDPSDKPTRVIDIVDAAAGQLAFVEEDENGSTMRVGEALDETARTMPTGWHGVLSPDGRHLGVEEGDELAVYDTTTAEDVTPDLSGYPFKVVYGWVNDDTAMAFALQSLDEAAMTADFLTCDIPTGTCEVVVADVEVHDRLTLPVGEPM